MKNDLLILKILKVPVTVIKYLSMGLAMLTYFPNYLLILVLDSIIFSQTILGTLSYYVLSWPFRLAALVGVVAIFSAEFYGLYMLLSISHLHWGVQLGLSFVAFQGVLALMRHGYLTMIRKFSPTKLKSPLEHLEQIWFMVVDLAGIVLALLNVAMIVNCLRVLDYDYSVDKKYNYLRYSTSLLHKSILDLIKLFYIKIFFRVFPWRYCHSIEDIQK